VKNTIRILYPFVGDSIGGSHISTLTLIRALPAEIVQPVIVVHQQGPLTDYMDNVGISWLELSSDLVVNKGSLLIQVLNMIRTMISLSWFLHRQDIDVVHTNDYRMHLTWLFPAVLSRTRMVWHQRSAIRSRRLDFYSSFANEIVTISIYCKKQFLPRMASRAKVITNPVDICSATFSMSFDKKLILKELEITGGAYVIGWVGNWYPHKRPLVFIELASRIIDKFTSPVIFVMFGQPREPMYSKATELIKKYRLENNIFIMGQRIPIEPWIAGCDVLASTAIDEGLGRSLMEAMMVGTPVVASADGGHLEIIEDRRSGRLVPSDDPDAFADAIAELLENPDYADNIIETAKKIAGKQYSVARHVNEMIALYKAILQ